MIPQALDHGKAEDRAMKIEVEISEVIPNWSAAHPFLVHEFSASGDSGVLLHSFATREQAVKYARERARLTGSYLHQAEVFPIRGAR